MPIKRPPNDDKKKQVQSQSSAHEFGKNKKERIPPARLVLNDDNIESSDEIERLLNERGIKTAQNEKDKKQNTKKSEQLFESLSNVVEQEAIKLGIKKKEKKIDKSEYEKKLINENKLINEYPIYRQDNKIDYQSNRVDYQPDRIDYQHNRVDYHPDRIDYNPNEIDHQTDRNLSPSMYDLRVKHPDDIKDINSVIVLFISPESIPTHKSFRSVAELRNFIRNPYTPPEFKNYKLCILETFSDLDNSLFKSRLIDGQRLFYCPIQSCKHSFKTISLTKRHYLKHVEIKPYKCKYPDCEKYFSRKDNQKLHSKKCKFNPDIE